MHSGAYFDQIKQGLRIPVGEAETAAGFGAAHFFRLGRAVDAIAGQVEADPSAADWIIRAGLYYKFLRDAFVCSSTAQYGRVECVIGFFYAHLDA